MNRKKGILSVSKSQIIVISLIVFTFLYSCHEDVIELDLNDIDSKIIIEGRLHSYPGPYTVKISKMSSLSESYIVHWISDASVRLYDNQGNFETLYEDEQGMYTTTSFRGIPGRNYTLDVKIDRKLYTAKSKMPEPLQIQEVNFEKTSSNEEYYKLTLSIMNDVSQPEYALIDIYRYDNISDSYLYSDKYVDSRLVILDDFSSYFNLNENVYIVVSTLDENVYEFYQSLETLQEISDELDNPLSPGALYNPTSNFSNGALGYFSAYSLRIYEVRVGS